MRLTENIKTTYSIIALIVALFIFIVCMIIISNLPKPKYLEKAASPILIPAERENIVIQIAEVFGKIPGCANQFDLIKTVAILSAQSGVAPKTIASIIATESNCDPFAISTKGAVGLMQVLPRAHKDEYDFTTINLFNPQQNIQVGIDILSKLAKDHPKDAIARYQGLGKGGDPDYVAKVKNLAK